MGVFASSPEETATEVLWKTFSVPVAREVLKTETLDAFRNIDTDRKCTHLLQWFGSHLGGTLGQIRLMSALLSTNKLQFGKPFVLYSQDPPNCDLKFGDSVTGDSFLVTSLAPIFRLESFQNSIVFLLELRVPVTHPMAVLASFQDAAGNGERDERIILPPTTYTVIDIKEKLQEITKEQAMALGLTNTIVKVQTLVAEVHNYSHPKLTSVTPVSKKKKSRK